LRQNFYKNFNDFLEKENFFTEDQKNELQTLIEGARENLVFVSKKITLCDTEKK
jgi:hypothetical protein